LYNFFVVYAQNMNVFFVHKNLLFVLKKEKRQQITWICCLYGFN